MDTLTIFAAARKQIEFAREYSLSLIASIDHDRWFEMPAGMKTNVAWQTGHLAMAEYGLCLFRVRGRRSEDLELMPSKFRKQYSRGSVPSAEGSEQPCPKELLEFLARIHAQVLREFDEFTAAQLEEPTDMPYAGYPTKLGAILFCPLHEMIHAGQIGTLRRALGLEPIR